MTAQELKNSILQLAIQGKLVKQDPNDEPASVLLEKIKEEREKLIKEKKIKKEKYSEIYKDKSDNHYYEKFEDGTINDITEQIPFDIPNNWKWVHFGDLFYTQSGLSYKKDNLNISSDEMYTIFRGGNIGEEEYFFKPDDLKISKQFIKENTILRKNSFITPAVTSLENIGKIALIDKNLDNCVAGGFVLIIYPIINNDTFVRYFLYELTSKYHKNNCKTITNKSGQAFYNLSREKMLNLLLPLPPLQEQKRITEKLKTILPLITKYNEKYEKIEILNQSYKNEIRKSVLQYAIQGNLVAQNVNDEPADILIQNILNEKRKLIKEKKIKKENLSVIYKDNTDNQFYEKFDDGTIINITDEIPFDIPGNWSWVRLNNIMDVRDGTHDSPKYHLSGIPLITSKNLSPKGLDFSNVKYISIEDSKKINERSNVDDGDILFAMIGSIGNPVIVKKTFDFSIKNMALFKNRFNINIEYIFVVLKFMQEKMKKDASGGVQKFVSLNYLRNFLIPFPPNEEQIRIVRKLDNINKIIETAE